MKRLLLVLFLFAAAGVAYAHNGMVHVMGTICAMTSTTLDVTTTKGDTQSVVVNGSTVWMRGRDAIKPTDAKIGERVVVHAKPQGGKLIAAEVEVAAKK